MSREDLYSTHAGTIDAVIKAVCRRHRLSADVADDLASRVHLKVLENDYAVLRRFEGRSSIRAYLVTIVERVLLDWRTSEWGKWRPCQQARRLGAFAIDLDRLLTRDGVPYEQAVETLLSQGRAASRAELDAIRPQLAARTGRRLVSGDVLVHVPAARGAADETVQSAEHSARAAKAGAALARVLRALSPTDQVLLRLRFLDGFTIARIAELIGEEQKPLYRRLARLFGELREALGASGISEDDVRELLSGPALDLGTAFDTVMPGKDVTGPSTALPPGGRHA